MAPAAQVGELRQHRRAEAGAVHLGVAVARSRLPRSLVSMGIVRRAFTPRVSKEATLRSSTWASACLGTRGRSCLCLRPADSWEGPRLRAGGDRCGPGISRLGTHWNSFLAQDLCRSHSLPGILFERRALAPVPRAGILPGPPGRLRDHSGHHEVEDLFAPCAATSLGPRTVPGACGTLTSALSRKQGCGLLLVSTCVSGAAACFPMGQVRLGAPGSRRAGCGARCPPRPPSSACDRPGRQGGEGRGPWGHRVWV